MTPYKKVEIVIDYMAYPALLQALQKAGYNSYTSIRQAIGKGERGVRSGDDLYGEFSNSYILIACNASDAEKIAAITKPFLDKAGGICLISDCVMV